jgi:hypothetical protein
LNGNVTQTTTMPSIKKCTCQWKGFFFSDFFLFKAISLPPQPMIFLRIIIIIYLWSFFTIIDTRQVSVYIILSPPQINTSAILI